MAKNTFTLTSIDEMKLIRFGIVSERARTNTHTQTFTINWYDMRKQCFLAWNLITSPLTLSLFDFVPKQNVYFAIHIKYAALAKLASQNSGWLMPLFAIIVSSNNLSWNAWVGKTLWCLDLKWKMQRSQNQKDLQFTFLFGYFHKIVVRQGFFIKSKKIFQLLHNSTIGHQNKCKTKSMELQNEKRKLIKSAKKICSVHSLVLMQRTHATKRHIRQINIAKSRGWNSVKIAWWWRRRRQ